MRKTLLLASTAILLSASALVQAHEAGDFIFRAGVGVVEPKSGNLNLPDLDLGAGPISASIEVDSGTSLTLTGTYMMTDNWAFDVLAAWPFKHDVDLDISGVGSVPIAEVEHLPPTLSIQYHFVPDAVFQPYVGLGVNYTTFLSEDLTAEARDAGLTDLSLDSSFGIAAQVGADWVLNDKWMVHFEARWINIESDADVTLDDGTGPVSGELGTVKIDPYVLSVELGYRF
jgi:outer membrane protein